MLIAVVALAATGCGHRAGQSWKILFLTDRDGEWSLYTMEPSGAGQRRVATAGSVDPFGETLGYGEPLVSPDGHRVLLARRPGLSVLTLASGATEIVGPGEESTAAWSPDGERLVFGGRDHGLRVAGLRSGERRTLLRSSTIFTTAWSPDGKWIAFTRQIGYGPDELDLIHPDGSGLRRISRYTPGAERGLAWSREGRLALIGGSGDVDVERLIVIDVDADRVHVLPFRLGPGTVAWSPDGRRIAYAAAPSSSQPSAVYTIDPDGSGRRRLTPSRSPYADAWPVWSKDGRSLLFTRTPIGGGAERYAPEVWSVRADGTGLRRLTRAFPDGGENLEPAWIRGPVHAHAAPRPLVERRGEASVLRVPFPVDGVAAQGDHAAIAPVTHQANRELEPTPPVLVWRPGHGEPTRLVASPCGGVQQLVLAGRRLAFDCNDVFFDELAQSMWVFDLRARVPHEVFSGNGGPGAAGIFLDHIVGGGRLLAFGSERRDQRGRLLRRTLWRVDAFSSIALQASRTTGDVVAAGDGHLAVELADGRVAIAAPDGTLVDVVSPILRGSATPVQFGVEPKAPFLLTGHDLVVLGRGTLRTLDAASGRAIWSRSAPAGARLEGAAAGVVVYTVGSSIHLVSRRDERVLRTSALPVPRLRSDVDRLVHAAITRSGLYYCFDVADRRFPGRVVFLPSRALPR